MINDIKDIPGYEGFYKISSIGEVYGQRFSTPLKYRIHNGYCWVALFKDGGKRKLFSIHRLVALTFIPNPEGYPQVNHKDGDKINNRVDNLEWITNKGNISHAVATMGMNCGEKQWKSRLTNKDVLDIYYSKESPDILADRYGTSRMYILRIQRAKTWKWLLEPLSRRRVLHGV